jgi:flagellar basal body P-ring formation protein FlgA
LTMKRFIFCAFLMLWCPSILFGMEVNFKDEAVVGGSMLTLADVAVLSPVSKAEVLSGLILFPSPDHGKQRCFNSSILKAYVLDAVVNKESVRWSGAETVCVRREGAVVSQNTIQAVINAELQNVLGHLSAEQVFFKAANLPDMPGFPTGQVEYEVLFSDRDIMKSRQVNVIVKVDGRIRENIAVSGQVQAVLPVVVAVDKLNRGTVLTRENIMTKPGNIAELKDPCLDPEAVVGQVLKKSVSMNQVISEHDLDLPVLIQRRQVVTMIFQKGSLRISDKGLASANGKMGDLIMIKNLKSNREVPCRVIGAGMTSVEF